jgi:hypothetical protein
MSLHSAMSATAINNRIDRDQTGAGASTLETMLETLNEQITRINGYSYKNAVVLATLDRLETKRQELLAHKIAAGQAALMGEVTERKLADFERETEQMKHELDTGYPGLPARRAEFVEQIRGWNAGPDDDGTDTGIENNLRDAGYGSGGPL